MRLCHPSRQRRIRGEKAGLRSQLDLRTHTRALQMHPNRQAQRDSQVWVGRGMRLALVLRWIGAEQTLDVERPDR